MSHKRTKRKKFVSAAVLITSTYASILFTLGMILGYLGTRYCYKRFIEKGPLKFLYINIGNWKVHLHHWIFGIFVMIIIFIGSRQIESHKFLAGVICGIIAHDIYDFNDWYKVVTRKRVATVA